jgi:hypothetical protein
MLCKDFLEFKNNIKEVKLSNKFKNGLLKTLRFRDLQGELCGRIDWTNLLPK